MQETEIFDVMKTIIQDVLQKTNQSISIDDSLRELGANSVDRAEIIIRTMSELKIKIPLVELAQAKNIRELIHLFSLKLPSSSHNE